MLLLYNRFPMNATQPASQPANPSLRPPAIHPLAVRHAADAARLHILGQPGTFLTSLGADLLAVLYRTLPVSPVGFGFAALDEAGQLLGFAAVTTSTGRLFMEMATRRLGQLLPPLLAAFARQPSLLTRSGQTLLYPLLVGGAKKGDDSRAELLAMMTEPAARSQGIGGLLLAAVCDECRARAVAELAVTVDATNSGARRFYERHGFVFRREFPLYGRAMALYARRLWDERGE